MEVGEEMVCFVGIFIIIAKVGFNGWKTVQVRV